MKLRASFKKGIEQVKKPKAVLLFLLLLIIPTPAFAAGTDKWYMKPFEWMVGAFFDYILTPFMGIHEPAYYIFYQGDGLIWGLYTQEQFDNAIKSGFNMMLFIVTFMLVSSIIQMGAQNAYGKFSASMKVDLLDNGLKILIALILLYQFFPIVNSFFQLNTYGVSLFESSIKHPTSLTDLGATILTSADGTKTPGDTISFTDIDNEGTNPIKNAIVSFFSLGVSIWFKAYYIQRMFVISGLIILAPIWIGTMFFPKLQGITSTAFKELWAQIIGQVIHAATFFLYYWLFDGTQDWFTYIIALSIFIPVSESIRFAMGATSNNASRMATIGTLAGAGAIMHMGRAVGDIKSGFKNSFMERKGAMDGGNAAGGGGSNGESSLAFSKEGKDRQYGGTANLNASPNKFVRNMRSFGHVAGGVGAAVMRTGGYAAGVGINPIGGHLAAEGGAEIGRKAGYGVGVTSYAGGKGIIGKAQNAQQGFKDSFEESREQGSNKFQATLSGIGGGIKEGTISSQTRKDPMRRNELAQKIGGAFGEASFGRGIGYHIGAENATKFAFKGVDDVDLSRLDTKQTYAVVTSNKGSYLAQKGPDNKLIQRTNLKAGDPSLPDGQKVIQEFKINSDEQGIRSFQPTTIQYAIQKAPSPNSNQTNQWKKVEVAMPVKQPDIQSFLNKKPTPPTKS